MSIWTRMANDIFERKAGRIRAAPGSHVFEAPDWLIEKTRKVNPRLVSEGKLTVNTPDLDGRDAFLVSQRSVRCPKSEGRQGIYPRYERGYCYPEKLCKKCEHRVPAGGKYKWPRCLLRAADDPKRAAAEEFMSCFTKAVEEAKEILG